MQLSQLEDLRQLGGDLPCVAQVFFSSICGATGDVVRNFNLSCVYLAVQVLSLGHGTVSPQDEEKCHWQVLFLQVSTLSQEYRA